MQVFGLYKDGALSAFDYERKVLGVLKQSPAESPSLAKADHNISRA
jgi:hypothetical protein